MKRKINFAIIFSLALILVLSNTCKRSGIDEPSPVGPSSISIVLDVSVSRNVIQTGETRQSSLITATLKKYDGVPIPDRTIIFEINDYTGTQASIGFFEGGEIAKTATTDGNGIARVTYYGPLELELNGSTTIYISAKVSWEGRQIISEFVPIKIIGVVTDKLLQIYSKKTVLYAGSEREETMVKAKLEKSDGTPLANMSLRFDIFDENGESCYLGHFRGNKQFEIKATDEDGWAYVDYFGPLSGEIDGDTIVYIHATLIGEESVTARTPIYIVEDGTNLILNVSADKTTLIAGMERESSWITVSFETESGSPIENQSITFDIVDSSGNTLYVGYYDDNKSQVAKRTDGSGKTYARYYGPLAAEIEGDTTVYIRVSADRGGETYTAMTPINIIDEDEEVILNVSADPTTLIAGTTRETSEITANLEDLEGYPIANETVVFEIVNSAGTAIYVGYFEGNKNITTEDTNAYGNAKVTYYGPLATEIDSDTTVYIKVTVNREGQEFTAMTPINIIDEDEEVILNVSADPNALTAGATRETSEITASLEDIEGYPIANQTVVFKIVNSAGTTLYVGYFEDNKNITSEETNSNGIAKVTYYGPLDAEIDQDTTVYIQVTVTRDGQDHTAMTPIDITDTTEAEEDVILNISANPTSIDSVAAEPRDTSTVTATLTTLTGTAISGETMIFTITDSSGTDLYVGYLDSSQHTVAKTSDASGQAQVTYSGPIDSEIPDVASGDYTTVYIKVTVTYGGADHTASAPIVVNKS